MSLQSVMHREKQMLKRFLDPEAGTTLPNKTASILYKMS